MLVPNLLYNGGRVLSYTLIFLLGLNTAGNGIAQAELTLAPNASKMNTAVVQDGTQYVSSETDDFPYTCRMGMIRSCIRVNDKSVLS